MCSIDSGTGVSPGCSSLRPPSPAAIPGQTPRRHVLPSVPRPPEQAKTEVGIAEGVPVFGAIGVGTRRRHSVRRTFLPRWPIPTDSHPAALDRQGSTGPFLPARCGRPVRPASVGPRPPVGRPASLRARRTNPGRSPRGTAEPRSPCQPVRDAACPAEEKTDSRQRRAGERRQLFPFHPCAHPEELRSQAIHQLRQAVGRSLGNRARRQCRAGDGGKRGAQDQALARSGNTALHDVRPAPSTALAPTEPDGQHLHEAVAAPRERGIGCPTRWKGFTA